MEPVMQRFRVNVDLKRYEKAVKNLARGDKELGEANPELREAYFSEALTLIKKHRLFKQAMIFYSHSPELTKRLNLAFGEYLE